MSVFISYAREDSAAARRLYIDLKKGGFQPWMDAFDLLPGVRWKSAIRVAIRESTSVLALLSNNSLNKRGFVNTELKHALEVLEEFPEDRVFIIPVRLEECRPPESSILNDLNWVDLFPSYAQGLDLIVKSLSFKNRELGKAHDVKLAAFSQVVSPEAAGTPGGSQEREVSVSSEKSGAFSDRATRAITFWASERNLSLSPREQEELVSFLGIASLEQLRGAIARICENENLSQLTSPQHLELVERPESLFGPKAGELPSSYRIQSQEITLFDIPGRLIQANLLSYYGHFEEALDRYWDLLEDFNPAAFKGIVAGSLVAAKNKMAFAQQSENGKNFVIRHRGRSAMNSFLSAAGIATVWSDKVGGLFARLFSPPVPDLFDVYSWQGTQLLSGGVRGEMVALTKNFFAVRDRSGRLAVNYLGEGQRFELVNFLGPLQRVWLRWSTELSKVADWSSSSSVDLGRARVLKHGYASREYKGESGWGSYQGMSMRGPVYKEVSGGSLEVTLDSGR